MREHKLPNLDISPRLATWRRHTDTPLLLLVSDRLSQTDRNFITAVNVIVFIAFAIDYLVE